MATTARHPRYPLLRFHIYGLDSGTVKAIIDSLQVEVSACSVRPPSGIFGRDAGVAHAQDKDSPCPDGRKAETGNAKLENGWRSGSGVGAVRRFHVRRGQR